MKLKFEGKVTTGDSSRVSYCWNEKKHGTEGHHSAEDCDEKNGALWIDGRDVVDEVGEVAWQGPVTCAIYAGTLTGDTAFQGALKIQQGWGYSEYTPMDSDKLFVGPHDILKILEGFKGQEITVWFADETINVLEGVVLR